MRFKKAIIPMGRPQHGDLPLQHVTTSDGGTKRVAALQIEELLDAGIAQVALVTRPGNERFFTELRDQFGGALVALEQREPRGFGDAILCAEEWVSGEPRVQESKKVDRVRWVPASEVEHFVTSDLAPAVRSALRLIAQSTD